MSLPKGGRSVRGGVVAWADPKADNTAAIIWRSLCDGVGKRASFNFDCQNIQRSGHGRVVRKIERQTSRNLFRT